MSFLFFSNFLTTDHHFLDIPIYPGAASHFGLGLLTCSTCKLWPQLLCSDFTHHSKAWTMEFLSPHSGILLAIHKRQCFTIIRAVFVDCSNELLRLFPCHRVTPKCGNSSYIISILYGKVINHVCMHGNFTLLLAKQNVFFSFDKMLVCSSRWCSEHAWSVKLH